MLKQILKIKGVNQLTKLDKKGIKGGFDFSERDCNQFGCHDQRDVCCNGVCIRFEHAIDIPNCY